MLSVEAEEPIDLDGKLKFEYSNFMGYSDIDVAMNVCIYVGLDDVKVKFARLKVTKSELKMMKII